MCRPTEFHRKPWQDQCSPTSTVWSKASSTVASLDQHRLPGYSSRYLSISKSVPSGTHCTQKCVSKMPCSPLLLGERWAKQSGIHHSFFICLCLGWEEASTERKQLLLIRSLQETLPMGNKMKFQSPGQVLVILAAKEVCMKAHVCKSEHSPAKAEAPPFLSASHSRSQPVKGVHLKEQAASNSWQSPTASPAHTCSGCKKLTAYIAQKAGPLFPSFSIREILSKHKKNHKDDELEGPAIIDKYQGISQKEIWLQKFDFSNLIIKETR